MSKVRTFKAQVIDENGQVVLELAIPIDTVEYSVTRDKENGKTVRTLRAVEVDAEMLFGS